MGPAAQLPLRAPKAPDPHAVQVLKRSNERKLAGWANDPARAEDESRVTPWQANVIAETTAPASPLPGVLQRSPTSKLDGRCLRPALPGRRLLKRIGALKPAERGEGDTA